MKTGSAMSLGAGLAAAAIGAALGSYLLTGKRAAKTKRVLKGWVLKAKGELLEQLENMEDLSQEAYEKAVDKVAAKYKKVSGVTQEEVDDMAMELKKQWKNVNKGLKTVKKLAK